MTHWLCKPNSGYLSGIPWSTPAMFVMLAMFGWAVGIVPAIIDGTISVTGDP